MILTNTETVPGKTIVEHFGLVSGSTVRAKHVGKDILAGLKNIVGGELKGYTELLRMKENARKADIILNVRIETSSIGQSADQRKSIGSIEALAYGTAVTLKK